MNKDSEVLLVYPGSKTMGFSYPMGLLYVAQSLRKIGIKVTILHLGVDKIKKLILKDYLFVGISMLAGEVVAKGLSVARLIKQYNKSIPIVLGGVHPSLVPEMCLRNDLIDVVVIGEGEKTIQELAFSLMNKGKLSTIKGIGYKTKEGEIIINSPRELISMEELEFNIPYELLGESFFAQVVMPVHTSRGCPYRCGFCYNPALNKRVYRYKSAERVIDEIEYLYKKYNKKFFSFDYEDEFFINYRRSYQILKSLIDRKMKIKWTSFCRFDTFDKAMKTIGSDFLEAIKDSGCHYISFGAESGSQRLLNEIVLKDVNIEQIERTISSLKDGGISHRVSFICCFPTETKQDMESTFNLIDRICYNNNFINVGLFKLVPLPATSIFDLLTKEYDYVPPSSLEGWGNVKIPDLSYKNVTWVSRQYAKKCCNMALLSSAPFYKNFESYRDYKKYFYNIYTTYLT